MQGTEENRTISYDEEQFRDSISTIDGKGKRVWIYPKKPRGRFYSYRKYVSYFLLICLFGLPLIQWNGRPFVLFNILEAEFILFGTYFAPQDFHLFGLAMIIGIVFISVFTVVYGRLFCGWVCPQTIFMEMVFRRIEYWIEGDANAQKRLNKSKWTEEKIRKKIAKHFLFIFISSLIAHTFLSYIIGAKGVLEILQSPIQEHMGGFIAMILFTAVFYGVFSVMREQVCTSICPYGRLQGVLLDEHSLAVSYDFVRGEPRGKLVKNRGKKKAKAAIIDQNDPPKANLDPTVSFIQKEYAEWAEPKGDCVDCALCQKVCPTGIDIRNGVQLECVNCTACMDACDEVMIKINRPTGLIRIDSHKGILNQKKSLWNTRVAAYTLLLISLIGLESFLFLSRSEVETLFLRTPGMLYHKTDDGAVKNLYNYQLVNKSSLEVPISFVVEGMEYVEFEPIGKPPSTLKTKTTEGAIFIKIPEDKLTKRNTRLEISVYGGDKLLDKTETTFLGPNK